MPNGNRLRDVENTYGYQKGKGQEEVGINEKFSINRYKQLYVKKTNNRDLLCTRRNYIRYVAINYNGKEAEKELYMCVIVYILYILCTIYSV